jgi:ribosomal protein L14E/L6E/L27E
MSAEILVSIGRVVYINFGELAGKTAIITDIIDGKRVIVANPASGIPKQAISNRRISLTRFLIPDVTAATKLSDLK